MNVESSPSLFNVWGIIIVIGILLLLGTLVYLVLKEKNENSNETKFWRVNKNERKNKI